ncbi:hypothetical protein [Luteimonas aquatica]|uniref:hypothetical protein n=1 Tax=Luteimonas aquatica TaxID=450364 RepID=UPI001F579F9C|nr:hypothetical protein [Luteimonas aquatica]
MPTPEEKKLDDMLKDFEAAHDTKTVHPGQNLRGLIDKTPELKADILESIKKGNLEKFENLSYPGAVGTYDAEAKTLAVSVDQLKNADKNVQSANTLRFTLGHELQHGVNRQDILDQDAKLRKDAAAIANGPSPHDYTSVLKDYDKKSRELETTAEIAGFNTLAESVKRQNPKATLKDLYDASPTDMQMYIDADLSKKPATYTAKPGLTIGSDLKIDPAKKENVEAVGKLFYDANGYPTGEISRAVGMVQDEEAKAQAAALAKNPAATAPEIRVDMKALGISGTLPPGFTDTSKPRLQPDAPGAQAQDAQDPRSQGHPDHNYYQMLRDKLPSSVPDNAVAHAMYLAKQDGMTEPSKVDPSHVSYSNGSVWVGGTTPGYRVELNPAQSPPMAEVAGQLDTQRTQQQEQARQEQTQTQAPQQNEPPRTHAPHSL